MSLVMFYLIDYCLKCHTYTYCDLSNNSPFIYFNCSVTLSHFPQISVFLFFLKKKKKLCQNSAACVRMSI